MTVDKTKLAEILALEGVEIPTDFAWGGQVKNEACSLEKLQVDNKEYSIPLTSKDVNAIKEAGTYRYRVIDDSATRTQQFPPYRISIPEPQYSALTSMLLDKLGFHPSDFDIRFYGMILCGSATKFSFEKNVDAQGKLEKFATMMVQIPLEGGFEGGQLNLYRQHQAKSFDFSSNSHDTLYAAIFNADSRNEMEQIKSGWRLIMVSYMSWKTSLKSTYSSRELLPFCKTLKQLRGVLEPWEQSEEPRLLVVPLKQKFSKSDLSFSALNDRDRWMSKLFQSTNQLDVHLTLLVKHQQWTPKKYCDIDDKYISKKYQRLDYKCDVDHRKELTETYGTHELWLGVNNKPICYGKQEINIGNELIGAVDNLLCGEPDEKRYDKDNGTEDDLSDCWYHWPVLVVWPKKKSPSMAFHFGFDGVFDLLERLAESASTIEDAFNVLNQVLAYCQEHPGHLWNTDSFSYNGGSNEYSRRVERLLRICIKLDASREALEVLKKLATEFKTVTDGNDCSRLSSAGVLTQRVAECIAELVNIYGWEYCSDAVDRFLTPEWIRNQIGRYANLVSRLLHRPCGAAAAHCGRRVISLIPESDLGELLGMDLLACVSAILKADEHPSTSHLAPTELLVGILHVLNLDMVCYLVINLRDRRESLLELAKKSMEFYRRLCAHLLSRDFISNGRLNIKTSDIFNLLKCFIWLSDFDLLQSFLKKLDGQNEVLRSIGLSEELREAFVSTTEGKRMLENLVDYQIAETETVEPTFTWEQQPGTIFARHPLVHDFLCGPDEDFDYCNFGNIFEARSFAIKFFSGSTIEKGYSAKVEVVSVGNNYCCRIVKTHHLYESRLRQYHNIQQQLASLKEVRHQLDYSPEPGPDAKRLRTVEKEEL